MTVCKFRVPHGAKRAVFEITNRCNLSCPYCVAVANHDKNDLSTKQIFTVLDKLKTAGFTDLKITGGEPFIRKDILDILAYASKRFTIDVSTNGLLLTPDIMKALSDMYLDMIHISLDGIGVAHNLLRGKGTFEKTIESIKQLKAMTDTWIRIGTVIHSDNMYSISKIVELASSLKVDEIIFSFLEPRNKIKKTDRLIVKGVDLRSWVTREIDITALKHPDLVVSYNWKTTSEYPSKCLGGKQLIYINSLGQVSPCSWSGVFTKESLVDRPLEELIQMISKKGFNCYAK